MDPATPLDDADRERLDRRLRAAEALVDVGRALAASLDPELVARRVAEGVRALVGGQSSAVYRLEPESGTLHAVAISTDGAPSDMWSAVMPPGVGISALAVRDRQPTATKDILADTRIKVTPPFRARLTGSDHLALLAAPLIVVDRVIGTLVVNARDGAVFGEAETALAQAFADQAALALETARQAADLRRREREAQILAGVAREINASRDLEAILRRVAAAAVEACDGSNAQIALRTADGRALEMRFGLPTNSPTRWAILPGMGMGGLVMMSGLPMRTTNYPEDPRFTTDYADVIKELGVAAQLVVPIRVAGQVEGLIYVPRGTTRPFTDRDEAILMQLADHAAIAIANAMVIAAEGAARAEAQASERRLRELVETLHAIVIEADVETGRLTFVSRQAEAVLGYPIADWLASATFWMDHLHPDEREGAASYCRAATAQGRDHFLEYRMVASDGHVVWFRHTGRVIADDAGDTRQIRILLVDITDRKRTEMLLGNEMQVMEAIAADVSLTTILDALCRAVDDQADETGSAVLLPDGDLAHLRVAAASGLPLDLANALDATGLRGGAAAAAAEDDKSGPWVTDPTTDDLWAGLAGVAQRRGVRTCWSVPILAAEGGALGLLVLFRRGTRRLLADDRQLMQRAARLASIAIGRARAREALRESEARYRGIVEDQTELIARASPDGVLTFVNDAFCRYVGMERADLLGRPFMPFVPEDDRPAVERHLAALGPARPIGTIEHRLCTSSGELLWQQWTDRLILDERGAAIDIQRVGRDVTDRRRAEQALVESEARYRRLFDFAGDAIVVADEEGRYVDVNPQAEKLTGYTRQELLTMRLRDLHPELTAEQLASAFETLKRRGTLSGEWSITRKDGTVAMLEYSATRVGPNRYWAAWRDITDRKRAERELRESEQRFQLAARATKDGVWEWDIANDRTWRSEGFTGLFGYPPADAVSSGSWWRSRIHPDDRERVLGARRDTLETGAFSSSIAYRFRRRDGTYADVFDRSYVVRDVDGRPLRMIGAIIDVTEQNRTAEAVRKEHALVRLLQVVAVAAHEASTIEDALQTCVDQVCAHTGWPVGHVLVRAGGGARDLVPVPVWHLADARRFGPFRAMLERQRYAPGEGLPGRVFASGTAETLTGGTPGFPAADEAQASGLGTAFAFPVFIRGEVGAVLEFFAPPGMAADSSFHGVMSTIGAQIGRVLERSRAATATRQLLHQVITAQEEERGRLARELHDDTAQSLAGLILGLAGLQKAPNVRMARNLARDLHARAAQALADVRLMARGLRPSALDDLGLTAALDRYALELARTRDLIVEIQADGLEDARLPPDVETALYRIAQEALTNVVKHANARSVSVVLARHGDMVRMTLRDDGVGFDASALDKGGAGDGLGLAGLEQRASLVGGCVQIESAPGRGTTVHVEIPLGRQEETRAKD